MKESVTVTKRKLDQDLKTKIYYTSDYDVFRKKDGNRDLNQGLVNKLYRSIMDNGWYDVSIIIIGDNMTVLDGQHRLEALKRIKSDTGITYKVRYVVSRELDDLKKIISWQKDRAAWTTNDYANSYSEMGNKHYTTYMEFRKKYKFSHTLAVILLMGNLAEGGRLTDKFRHGHFVVNDYSQSEQYALRVQSLQQYYDFATNRNFVRAMMYFWKHPQFSHKEFMDRVSKYRGMLYNCISVKQFHELIAGLYNYRRRERVTFVWNGK